MGDLFCHEGAAVISPCEKYRYLLSRHLDPAGKGACLFIMLNPSTADATADDPTIRRCIGFARSWGYHRLSVVNLFAWRATDPAAMRAAADPVGPANDAWIRAEADKADVVVCAWGKHGAHAGRGATVREMLAWRHLHVLAKNKDGSPKHPLYVKSDTRPGLWLP